MGIRHLATVLYDVHGLDPTAKLVLLAIADHINDETGYGWPSMQRLATIAGIDRRSVVRWVEWLEKAGHLTVSRKPGWSNGYRLTRDTHVTPTSDTHVTGGVTPVTRSSDTGVTRTRRTRNNQAPAPTRAATPTPPPLALVLAQQDKYR